jgi:two-component system, OmpR family, KDP operon response regulator KdpE
MSEATVLLVDDDPALVRVITVGFEARGYEVRVAKTGTSALDQAAVEDPDLVILDLGLPDIDGIDVCEHLRRWSRAPIIVLSADGAEDRKVRALDVGADDYLTKPFSLPELLARVRVALRHRRALASIIDDDVVAVGSLRIDTAGHVALLQDETLELRPKEFALLSLLARNAGKVLTHRVLLDQVWGPGQAMDTLRTHISHLRRKLAGQPGAPTLVTEPGVGYRLLAPDAEPPVRLA